MSPEEKQLLSWKHTSVLVSEFLTLSHWVFIFLINGVLHFVNDNIDIVIFTNIEPVVADTDQLGAALSFG